MAKDKTITKVLTVKVKVGRGKNAEEKEIPADKIINFSQYAKIMGIDRSTVNYRIENGQNPPTVVEIGEKQFIVNTEVV